MTLAVDRPHATTLLRNVAAVLLLLGVSGAPAEAQPIKVKMATLVPAGSAWHDVLKDVAEKWKTLSGGKVQVILGVAEVDRSVYALGVPMMFSSYDEVYGVLDKMRPKLEAALLAKGFVVLNWADGGWVHFFSKRPVKVPDDLKGLKLFSWAGDDAAVELWRSGGFNPVPLPSTEISTALQTGLVEALPSSPQVAVISQFYKNAPYMTDVSWQLLLGATLINKTTWDQIPADLHPALAKAAEEAGEKLRSEMRTSGEGDVAAMEKSGLHLVTVDAAQKALWTKTAESLYPKVRGPIVPAEAFDEALRLRDEYRKQHPPAH